MPTRFGDYLAELLKEREEALKPKKPSFGIHVLGTMVHDIIGWWRRDRPPGRRRDMTAGFSETGYGNQ